MNEEREQECGAFDELMACVNLMREREEFEGALNHFYEKAREQGVVVKRSDSDNLIYTWPEKEQIVFEVPRSRRGVEIRLFVEPTPGTDPSMLEEIPDLEEMAPFMSKTAHLLVQSRFVDDTLGFSYRENMMDPDSKYSEFRSYEKRLGDIESAKKGMDLAFEIYRGSNEVEPSRDHSGPSLRLALMR